MAGASDEVMGCLRSQLSKVGWGRRVTAFLVTENDMITRMDQRKRGRPSKGQRTVLAGRVPIPTKDDAHRRAAELGMTLNDYMAWLIERDVAAHPSRDPERNHHLGRTA